MRYKLEISLTARIVNGLGLRRNPFARFEASHQPAVITSVKAHAASSGQESFSSMSLGRRI